MGVGPPKYDPKARADAEKAFTQQMESELPVDVEQPAQRQRPEAMDSDDWNSKWWIRGFKAARIENEEQVSELAQVKAQMLIDAEQERRIAAEQKLKVAEQRLEDADKRMDALSKALEQSMQALTQVSGKLHPQVSRAVRAEVRARLSKQKPGPSELRRGEGLFLQKDSGFPHISRK